MVVLSTALGIIGISVSALSYYSNDFRLVVHKTTTFIGDKTSLNVEVYSIICALILYLWNGPIINFDLSLKKKILFILLSNYVLLSILGFCFEYYSYVSETIIDNEKKINWNDFREKYSNYLKKNNHYNKNFVYQYTSFFISLATVLMQYFPWKSLFLPFIYFLMIRNYLKVLNDIKNDFRDFLGKLQEITVAAINVSTRIAMLYLKKNLNIENDRTRSSTPSAYLKVYFDSINYDILGNETEYFRKLIKYKSNPNNLTPQQREVYYIIHRLGAQHRDGKDHAMVSNCQSNNLIHYVDPEYIFKTNSENMLKYAANTPITYKGEDNIIYTYWKRRLTNQRMVTDNSSQVNISQMVTDNTNQGMLQTKTSEELVPTNPSAKMENVLKKVVTKVYSKESIVDVNYNSIDRVKEEINDALNQKVNIKKEEEKEEKEKEEKEEERQIVLLNKYTIIENKYTYIGELDVNGLPNGKGTVTDENTKESYIAEFTNGYLDNIYIPRYGPLVGDLTNDLITTDDGEYGYLTDENGNLIVSISTKEEVDKYANDVDQNLLNEFADYKNLDRQTVEQIEENYVHVIQKSNTAIALEVGAYATAILAAGFVAYYAGAYYMGTVGFNEIFIKSVIKNVSYKNMAGISTNKLAFNLLGTSVKKHGAYNIVTTHSLNPFFVVGATSSIISPMIKLDYAGYIEIYDILQKNNENQCKANKSDKLCKSKSKKNNTVYGSLNVLKENLLKLKLMKQDYINKEKTDIDSFFLDKKTYIKKTRTSILTIYCTDKCELVQSDFLEFFSYNGKLKDEFKQMFLEFYIYNDVNLTKGVYDWGFLLYDIVNSNILGENITCYNKNKSNDLDRPEYKDLFKKNLTPSNKNGYDIISISKYDMLKKLEEYMIERLLTNPDEWKNLKLRINDDMDVMYEDLLSFVKNILCYNDLIYTNKQFNQDNKNDQLLNNHLQFTYIYQYFNFGYYKIVQIDETHAFIKGKDNESEKVELEFAYEKVAQLNLDMSKQYKFFDSNEYLQNVSLTDGRSSLFVNTDVYREQLLQLDIRLQDIFSEQNYDSKPELTDIKNCYKRSINYYINSKVDDKNDYYILLREVSTKKVKTNDKNLRFIMNIPEETCKNYGWDCYNTVNMLKFDRLVKAKDITDENPTYYISLNDFYKLKNIRNIKDIKDFEDKKFMSAPTIDSTSSVFTEYIEEIDSIYKTFQFQIDHIKIYKIDNNASEIFVSSIVLNNNVLKRLHDAFRRMEKPESEKSIELTLTLDKKEINVEQLSFFRNNIFTEEQEQQEKERKQEKEQQENKTQVISYADFFQDVNTIVENLNYKEIFSPFQESKIKNSPNDLKAWIVETDLYKSNNANEIVSTSEFKSIWWDENSKTVIPFTETLTNQYSKSSAYNIAVIDLLKQMAEKAIEVKSTELDKKFAVEASNNILNKIS